jgi:hypothetical protein
MFSLLESVTFDTGYAGSNDLETQSWVNGNVTSYIYFGSVEFDGQGSGHDFLGTLYMSSTGFINNCYPTPIPIIVRSKHGTKPLCPIYKLRCTVSSFVLERIATMTHRFETQKNKLKPLLNTDD